MSATTNIILDTRRIKNNKKYPIKLKVTFEWVTDIFKLSLICQ